MPNGQPMHILISKQFALSLQINIQYTYIHIIYKYKQNVNTDNVLFFSLWSFPRKRERCMFLPTASLEATREI